MPWAATQLSNCADTQPPTNSTSQPPHAKTALTLDYICSRSAGKPRRTKKKVDPNPGMCMVHGVQSPKSLSGYFRFSFPSPLGGRSSWRKPGESFGTLNKDRPLFFSGRVKKFKIPKSKKMKVTEAAQLRLSFVRERRFRPTSIYNLESFNRRLLRMGFSTREISSISKDELINIHRGKDDFAKIMHSLLRWANKNNIPVDPETINNPFPQKPLEEKMRKNFSAYRPWWRMIP